MKEKFTKEQENRTPEEEKLLWEKRQKKAKVESVLTDILQVILGILILVGIFFLIKWIIVTPILTVLSIILKVLIGTILIFGIVGLLGSMLL